MSILESGAEKLGANLRGFSELTMSYARELATAAELGAVKSIAATRKVAKAAYRARIGVAQKGGKLAFVAMGVPAVAAGFEAWAAATEAQKAASAKKREKALIWGRAGALAISSVACCAAPWIGGAALVASGAAAGASLIAAFGNFAEAARERSKSRPLSARASSSIGAVRLAAFSVMAVSAATAGTLMLPIAAAAMIGSETLVSALSRKTQATRRLCKMRNREEKRIANEAAAAGALDDAYQCRPEAFGALVAKRRGP